MYKVVEGSESAHCCFAYTVVDTSKPVIINGKQYDDQFEAVCETFEKEDAEKICNALNARSITVAAIERFDKAAQAWGWMDVIKTDVATMTEVHNEYEAAKIGLMAVDKL